MSDEALRNSPLRNWMQFLDARLRESATIDAATAAALVFEFTDTKPTEPGAIILKRASEALGVIVHCETETASVSGTAAFKKESDGLWPESLFVVQLGGAASARRRFVNAHEIAHAVLYSLMCHPHVRAECKELYTDELDRESFCNDFSRHLMLAPARHAKISFDDAHARLGERDRDWADRLWSNKGPRLTFQHLRAVAGVHKISIRCLISVLHRHPLLTTTECGIAVMRVVPNRVTGREIGLRIWQRACPQWGYLATNQRAERQGFSCATEVFKTEGNQRTNLRDETLTVKVADTRPSQCGPKWPRASLPTRVAYTPVDVKEEGRYLVGIWSWPRPRY